MSRAALIQSVIGLGPGWEARPGWFDQHPAALSRQLAAPTETDLEPAEALAPPRPEVAAPLQPAAPFLPPPSADIAPPIAPPPPSIPASPLLEWDALERAVRDCSDCRLCQTRTQTVFGRGNKQARWLLIGEAPGEQEDRQGQPFVGRAGQLLDNMLAATGLDRDRDVYIANVLKCRPPGNRNPSGDEIAACQNYLIQQIRHIQPTLILALGRFAAQTLLQTEKGIGQLRGKLHSYQEIPLIVSYHPAYLLRNQPDKHKAWQDLVFAKNTFGRLSGD
ncbi:DNA polymerase [Chromobacterium alkanivorans]|uniref:uracil-DNA glycosylase n=1 Tax=Chromobacterium alkanivorans TaxID=1071719 RepID=UPI00216885BD|nr:uracil-DNA glycosylase [Chromobacterium alkanivorans]MCS3806332.1 DNA polymerase [Chromobacterium alkanivorans]MCS3820656.1 DNA polymerase [Chromobacterium alkanivorans]MCS3875414.1 DNA polymerase [Chromobacterium alkanivorans]